MGGLLQVPPHRARLSDLLTLARALTSVWHASTARSNAYGTVQGERTLAVQTSEKTPVRKRLVADRARRTSKADQVYTEIKEAILSGALAPGGLLLCALPEADEEGGGDLALTQRHTRLPSRGFRLVYQSRGAEGAP